MAIKNFVSKDFLSTLVICINVFNCRIFGVIPVGLNFRFPNLRENGAMLFVETLNELSDTDSDFKRIFRSTV